MRALLVASLLLPSAAAAQPLVALRLGYAPSLGSAAAALPISQVVRGQVPVQADGLWRFGESGVAAGAYLSYGLGLAGGCDPGARCSASSVRLGVEGTFTFRARSASVAPWAGAGLGYEWTTRRRSGAGGGEVEWAYRGPELSVQGGADLLRHGGYALGPFLLVAFGRYTNLALETPVESAAREIAGKRIHGWIELGVRGTLDL